MAEENPNTIDIPSPPIDQNNHGYYFVYGEWTQVFQPSTIATAENPNPTGQVMQRKMGMNESISMHPLIWTIMCQQARPGYQCKAWGGISKELYDWHKEVERRIQIAMQGSKNGG